MNLVSARIFQRDGQWVGFAFLLLEQERSTKSHETRRAPLRVFRGSFFLATEDLETRSTARGYRVSLKKWHGHPAREDARDSSK